MIPKKNHPFIFLATAFLFFAVTIFDSAAGFSITIKSATPLVILPLLTAFSVFTDIKKAAFAGFLSGACVDSVARESYCFNTIALMLIATAVCLLSDTLFNKNIRAATVLSLFTAVLYFVLNWFVFDAIGHGSKQSLEFLFSYSLPSALYTSLFIFPFYFIFKHFDNIKNQ